MVPTVLIENYDNFIKELNSMVQKLKKSSEIFTRFEDYTRM